MKNIEPHAELPALDRLHFTGAMPSRVPRAVTGTQGKNLTGLYVGMQDTTSVPRNSPCQPVSSSGRGRGMPSQRVQTPTEKRRYVGQVCVATCFVVGGKCPHIMNIAQLPPMPLSRYPLLSLQNKVELLRMHEKKQGFTGQPLKRKPGGASQAGGQMFQDVEREIPKLHQHKNVWDMTKQTNRAFTAATNSGITHLEYLSSDPSGPAYQPTPFQKTLVETVARDIHDTAAVNRSEITGLIECYKKVCKGNIEALYSLLPVKKLTTSSKPPYKYTGFSVKSYQSPQQGELLSSFPPPPDPRPRTVIGGTTLPAHVPRPYFFKAYAPKLDQRHQSAGFDGQDEDVGESSRFSPRHHTRPLPDPLHLNLMRKEVIIE